MMGLLVGGLVLWALAIVVALALCRTAARADERAARARLAEAGRRRATVSLAVAAVTLVALPDDARAERTRCANRGVEFRVAPALAREALRCEIARARARHDVHRLRSDPQLELAAARHAADMVQRRYFAHTSPGGGDVGDRAQRAGYAASGCTWTVGEILAWGAGRRSTAAALVRAWMSSPSHRRILVSRRYRELGVGLRAGTPVEGLRDGVTAAAVLGRRRCP
jgi:uncharacterized protein YkwD